MSGKARRLEYCNCRVFLKLRDLDQAPQRGQPYSMRVEANGRETRQQTAACIRPVQQLRSCTRTPSQAPQSFGRIPG